MHYAPTEEYVINTKTGSVARVIARYNDTRNGKPKLWVKPLSQFKETAWLASNTEAHNG